MARRKTLMEIFTVALIATAAANSVTSPEPASPILTTSPSSISVQADYGGRIGENNLSVGAQTWSWLPGHPEVWGQVAAAKFSLIRVFVSNVEPALFWNETTHTGSYDWRSLDGTIKAIESVGAQPMLVIGGWGPSGYLLPPGMVGNYSGSSFPSDRDFDTYAASIVRHLNIEEGWRVRYWEVWNEPYIWRINQSGRYYTEMGLVANFTRLFNAAQQSMHTVDSKILIGNDRSNFRHFFDYFVRNAVGVGFLSFHKYEAWGTPFESPEGNLDEKTIMHRSNELGDLCNYWYCRYTPQEMIQIWLAVHGEILQVICSETNLNSAWKGGADPRTQTIFGAAWYAESLRVFVLNDVSASVYYVLSSDDSPEWGKTILTGGAGFGMMNSTPPFKPWYPYWVNVLFGNNLSVGSTIYNSTSSNSTSVSSLAWRGNETYYLLLIGKTNTTISVNLKISGLPLSGNLALQRLELNRNAASLQQSNEVYQPNRVLTMNGYSITLLAISHLPDSYSATPSSYGLLLALLTIPILIQKRRWRRQPVHRSSRMTSLPKEIFRHIQSKP